MAVARLGDDGGKTGNHALQALLEIRNLILQGGARPGERLSELALAERLGLSRTPIRTALARLEQEGLLEAIPSGGFAVRAFSQGDINDAIELRGVLEGTAARLAAERGAAPAALARIRQVLSQLDNAVATLEAASGDALAASFDHYVALNEDFHGQLHALCRGPLIATSIERVLRLPFASPSAFVDAQRQHPAARRILSLGQAQHHAIIEAIELREGARAEALCREHARIARHNLELIMNDEQLKHSLPGLALLVRP